MTTEKVKEIVDDVFAVYYSEYMGQGDYGEEEAQEALDTALNALDKVEKLQKALEKVERDIESELLWLKFIDDNEAKNSCMVTLKILCEFIKGVSECSEENKGK